MPGLRVVTAALLASIHFQSAAGTAESSADANVHTTSDEGHDAQMQTVLPLTPIILDNMDTTINTDMMNANEGTSKCTVVRELRKDAYKQQFHHDWARNKGRANFSFKFDPPLDGCYKIEEYHPGKETKWSRYLPRNARLDADYCKGLFRTFYINQAVRASQWNEIGALMFYKGTQGRLMTRSSLEENCGARTCFWVVDAYRITRIGSQCIAEPNSSTLVRLPPGRAGVLSLRASIGDAGDASTVQMMLTKHRAVIEVELESIFGYKAVQIQGIAVDGRRLAGNGGRTLFKINFQARGVDWHTRQTLAPTGGDLMRVLQAALTVAGADILLHMAELEWMTPPLLATTPSEPPATTTDEADYWLAHYWLVGLPVCLATSCLLLACSLLFCKRASGRKTKQVKDDPMAPSTDTAQSGIAESTKECWEICSVSTGTPASESLSNDLPANEEGCGSESASRASTPQSAEVGGRIIMVP